MADTPEAERARNRAAEQVAALVAALTRRDRVAGFAIPFFAEHPDPGNPTNFWAFMGDATIANNKLHVRRPDGVVMTFNADSISAPTTAAGTLPVEADIGLFSMIWPATWAATYCELHGVETGPVLGYGYDPGHGMRTVMIGFDNAAIAADLAGAVVRSVEFSMINANSKQDPVLITFGLHNSSTQPAAYTPTWRDLWADEWPPVGMGEEWREPDGAQLIRVGEWLRDNICAGLTIDQPDQSYSGQLDWASARLRINSTK